MSYYSEYYENESDAGSQWSQPNRRKVNDFMTDANADKLRFKITRNVPAPYSNYITEKKKIIIFGSGQQGTTIRNAVTGEKYVGHLVGSKNEYNYYKVGLCTGEVGGRDPVILFYESQDQYERHMSGAIHNNDRNQKRRY